MVKNWCNVLSIEGTRDNTFSLIRSCGKDVYKVEKSKDDTWELWKIRSCNFSMTPEEFLMDQKIILLLLKAVLLYFTTWSLTAVRADVICLDGMVVAQ